MNDNDGFPHEHDEAAERHGDTWVAGGGSVAAPEDETTGAGSPEGASGWEHGTEHTTDAGGAWDAPHEEAGTTGEAGAEGGAGTTGVLGDHEGATGDEAGSTEGGAFGDHDAGAFEHDAGADHDADAPVDTTAHDLGGGHDDLTGAHDDLTGGHDDLGGTHDETVGGHDTVTDETPAADTTTGTAATTDNGAPPAADTAGEQIEHLIDPAESDRFHAAWREIQSSFVDDPRDAVHQASTLAEEVLNALSTALKSRVQAVEEGWQGGDGASDTERLRIALRGYRALLDQVLEG